MWKLSKRRASAVDHHQARVREAADQAITSASRRARAGGPSSVTVADVRERARDDFALEISDATARTMLRERFELRAGAIGLTTDAWD
jgi:hypothetical protein